MDALVRPGPDVNHADMFQPLIVDLSYTHILNITLREFINMSWGSSIITIYKMKLYGCQAPRFDTYWRRKVEQPYTFTARDIEIMSQDADDLVEFA
jgi:hypothetical protein